MVKGDLVQVPIRVMGQNLKSSPFKFNVFLDFKHVQSIRLNFWVMEIITYDCVQACNKVVCTNIPDIALVSH